MPSTAYPVKGDRRLLWGFPCKDSFRICGFGDFLKFSSMEKKMKSIIMANQMEQKRENDMEARVTRCLSRDFLKSIIVQVRVPIIIRVPLLGTVFEAKSGVIWESYQAIWI